MLPDTPLWPPVFPDEAPKARKTGLITGLGLERGLGCAAGGGFGGGWGPSTGAELAGCCLLLSRADCSACMQHTTLDSLTAVGAELCGCTPGAYLFWQRAGTPDRCQLQCLQAAKVTAVPCQVEDLTVSHAGQLEICPHGGQVEGSCI